MNHFHPEGEVQPKRFILFGLVLLAVVTTFVYLAKYGSFFTRDDFVWLNLAKKGISDIFSTSNSGFFMPIPKIFFWVALHVFGTNPVPYNIVNVAFTMGIAAVLALFIYRLTNKPGAAVIGAAVFALSYPAYEAVSWISSIVWQFTVLFVMLASVFYLSFRTKREMARGGEHQEQESLPWRLRGEYLAAIIFGLLAFLTKEAAVTLPFLILMLELLLVQSAPSVDWRKRVKTGALYVAPFFGMAVVYGSAQLGIQSSNPLVQAGKWSFGGHVFTNYLKYANWLFLVPPSAPSGGSSFLTQGSGHALLSGIQIVGYIVLPLIFLVIIIWGNSVERFAIAWIVIALIPVVMFNSTPSSRYVYLPTVGFAILLGEVASVRVWANRKKHRVVFSTCAALIVLFLIASTAGCFLGVRRFAARTNLDRNISSQLDQLDAQYNKGEEIKLLGVPDVIADQNGITSMVRLYCKNLMPAQTLPNSTPGIILFKYVGPDGQLVRVK